MAEVFLALQEAIGGFEKLVVVKRIFKHFCEDEAFVQMFLDEARLAASIRHPNVVEILDIKKDGDGFFIVMEYLSGENLAYIFEELADRGRLMPAHLVCRIGAEIAGGLHSAHIATDVDGKLQPIIHRDVTPSNAIVCFNGVVKLVDFGVAKAQVSNKQTRPGTLKGKLEYLAPEQVENKAVGPMTDVFQLGVVLHELFTGERMFSGDSDHAIMNAILEREIPPPSSLRADLPSVVDDVVMAALERDPEKRTQSADKLRKGLEGVMRHLGTNAAQRSLGEWMSVTFEERKNERIQVERECVQQVREGRAASEVPAMLAPFAPTAPVVYDAERATAATVAERPSQRMPIRGRRGGRGRMFMAGAGVLALGTALFLWLRPAGTSAAEQGIDSREKRTASADDALATDGVAAELSPVPAAARSRPAGEPAAPVAKEEPPATYEAILTVTPPTARIYFDGELVGTGTFSRSFARNGESHRVGVRATGYESQTLVFRDAPPPRSITLQRTVTTSHKTTARRRSPSPKADKTTAPVVESKPGAGEGDNRPPPKVKERTLPPTDNRNPWKTKP